MQTKLVIIMMLAMLSACSSGQEEAATENEGHEALYNAVSEPLEKAKAVEQQLMDNEDRQRKQVDGL